MRNLIIGFLVLLTCTNAFATSVQPASNVPSLTVGGRVFTDLTNLIILYCNVATASHYTTCRKASGTSGYQVTAGKTLTVYAASALSNGSGGIFTVGYGDTDIGIDSASAPTNPKYLGGGTVDQNGALGVSQTTAGVFVNVSPGFDFAAPATKYVVMESNATNIEVQLYGYEQ